MAEKRVFKLVHAQARRLAVETVQTAPDGYCVTVSEPTRSLEQNAARGECGWICSGCCTSDHRGMPDECFHGSADCTRIIQRDKAAAIQEAKEAA